MSVPPPSSAPPSPRPPSRAADVSGPARSGPPRRPTHLLTQNREMRKIGVWNWSLPAWAGRLPDGRTYNTCPSAGICARVCYARHGTYTWPVVRAKHHANLTWVLDDLPGWQTAMEAELGAAKFNGAWIRIHDSGDFFSDPYLTAWLRICRARPNTNFYAYTKEVARFRALVEPDPPPNFWWVYSYGGTQDATLNPHADRVADVFPDEAAIARAGWASQEANDLLAVLGPRLVGIPANHIPAALSRLAGRRFSHWQADTDNARAHRAARRTHRHQPPTAHTTYHGARHRAPHGAGQQTPTDPGSVPANTPRAA
jgi:protein gp88